MAKNLIDVTGNQIVTLQSSVAQRLSSIDVWNALLGRSRGKKRNNTVFEKNGIEKRSWGFGDMADIDIRKLLIDMDENDEVCHGSFVHMMINLLSSVRKLLFTSPDGTKYRNSNVETSVWCLLDFIEASAPKMNPKQTFDIPDHFHELNISNVHSEQPIWNFLDFSECYSAKEVPWKGFKRTRIPPSFSLAALNRNNNNNTTTNKNTVDNHTDKLRDEESTATDNLDTDPTNCSVSKLSRTTERFDPVLHDIDMNVFADDDEFLHCSKQYWVIHRFQVCRWYELRQSSRTQR